MLKLFTLTVPDVLWINLQVTGAPQAYSFATLEEGTFYQFKNGRNDDFAGQAARFLTGFRKLAPFASGNESTAFVGCVAFLEMNGLTLAVGDNEAAEWLAMVWDNPETGRNMIAEKIVEHELHGRHGVPDCSEIVESILERFSGTVQALSNSTAAA